MELITGPIILGNYTNIINANTKDSIVLIYYDNNGNLKYKKFDNTEYTIPLPISVAGGEILTPLGSITNGSSSGEYNKVTVTPVTYLWNGQKYDINTPTEFLLPNGDATYDRIDAVYIDTLTNTISYQTGTPALNPVLPDLSSEKFLIGAFYTKANADSTTLDSYKLIYTAFNSQWIDMQINGGVTIKKLVDLQDVSIVSPQNNDVLVYNTSISKWENQQIDFTSGNVDISYVRSDPTTVTVGGYPAGSTPNFPTIQDALDAMLYPFIQPNVAIASSSLHEKGLTINKSMTYSVTTNSATVDTRTIFYNGSAAFLPPSNNGTYNSLENLTWANSPNPSLLYYSHNFQYYVTFLSPATPKTSNLYVEFAAPSYYGTLDLADIDETNIKTLTKTVRKEGNFSAVFNPTNSRYIYAYPKVYGTLSSIKDPNNFEIKDAFTFIELTFTLVDTTSEVMYVYYNKNDTTQVNYTLSFFI